MPPKTNVDNSTYTQKLAKRIETKLVVGVVVVIFLAVVVVCAIVVVAFVDVVIIVIVIIQLQGQLSERKKPHPYNM